MSQDAKDQDTKEKLFSWNFALAILINLCITTVFFILVTAMAVYAATEFGAGETAAGFAASAFVVGALGARFFAGKYVNTLGRKPILVICLLIFTLAGVAYPVIDSYGWLIALRLFHGIALGFGQTALTSAVFDIIPRSRRGEGSGYYLLANSLPPALGPLAAIQLTAVYGYTGMFTAVSLISALSFLFACLIRTPEVKQPGTPLRERLRLGPSDVIEPRVFPIAVVAMLLGLTFASVMTFLNGYAQSLGMTDAASIYFVVYAATMLVARLFMGRIQDRYGDNVVIMPALGGFIVSMGLLAWSPHQGVMIAAGVLAGFGFGALLPAIQAVIASKLRTHRISIGISTFFIMMDMGFGFAPLALGPVVEAFGYHVMYAGCAAVVVLTLGLYWLVHGKFSVRQGVARRRTRGWVNDATGVLPRV
ncbi:MFS transporter [Nesterenkonia alkaliphila]|uniref:MFS transporter n=1 Tax=Nesterenkonia alkaliphila TaxID=1463631 RepID=A0A7K1UHK2_9MICC|nr:MFS transporter [Nesterenkonia alkaliphila]MVT25886.1 MFS transporter [Nesterenkonia alkaliphila]GFZ76415.1 MFS transporter [Nesterenkonia alkaliphila]